MWAWQGVGGGGGAVTQFLGGVSALLSGDSPCLGLGELLGEECEEERGGLGLLAWLDYVLSQGCLNLRSTLPFSLWGAEESVPYSLGVWRVSLWSSEARIGFCLSVQLPSFRVFLTPPSSLLLLSVCCLGCGSVSVSGGLCCREEKCCSGRGELACDRAPGKGLGGPLDLWPWFPVLPRKAVFAQYLL